jgi:hypothetical protein
MDAPTVVTLKFPQFGKEPPIDLNEDPPDFVKALATDSRETVHNLPAVVLPRRRTVVSFFPRMQTIANVSNILGVALIAGALVQIFYSGLAPMDAWGVPALCSFLAVMLLNVLLLF